ARAPVGSAMRSHLYMSRWFVGFRSSTQPTIPTTKLVGFKPTFALRPEIDSPVSPTDSLQVASLSRAPVWSAARSPVGSAMRSLFSLV
ncbi:hypothetical protein, partial [Cylindrospermopsis raciborskii]